MLKYEHKLFKSELNNHMTKIGKKPHSHNIL